jgi:F420-non-reducing hydrogenase large subunit
MHELANDPEITSPNVRTIPAATPKEGIGVVEAPRWTLIHHYQTDEKGLITKANLIVATQNNAARIAMSVDKAARNVIKNGKVGEGVLNLIEIAFRAYDPCHGCATHALPGQMHLIVRVYDSQKNLLCELRRD